MSGFFLMVWSYFFLYFFNQQQHLTHFKAFIFWHFTGIFKCILSMNHIYYDLWWTKLTNILGCTIQHFNTLKEKLMPVLLNNAMNSYIWNPLHSNPELTNSSIMYVYIYYILHIVHTTFLFCNCILWPEIQEMPLILQSVIQNIKDRSNVVFINS